MALPKSFTTVTTFSKILALVLFITMPITGFYLGMTYEKSLSSLKGADARTQIFSTQQDCELFTNRRCVPTLCESDPAHISCKTNNQKGWFATRVSDDPTSIPTPKQFKTADELEAYCKNNNGRFLYELNETNKYMECEGIDENTCTSAGGRFDGCASPCRHDPNAEVCIQVCVAVCSF